MRLLRNGMCFGLFICFGFTASGQETNEKPLELPGLPSLDLKPIEVAPEAERQIQQTLGRESPPNRDLPADSILEDVLNVIRKRGSVLDGSVVDEIADEVSGRSPSDIPPSGLMSNEEVELNPANSPVGQLDFQQRQQIAESIEMILQAARQLEETSKTGTKPKSKAKAKKRKRSQQMSASFDETLARLRGIAVELLVQLEPDSNSSSSLE